MPDIDVQQRPASGRERSAAGRPGAARQVVEALVCLAVAVILFRAFEVEGYMISSGSMAPFLRGYHKRVQCPVCRYRFPLGMSEQEVAAANAGQRRGREWTAQCPHCGQDSLDVTQIPSVQGDQLLVHKHAYLFVTPQRWEVIVFRNPRKPSQAYVKRVAGLPGESIQLIHGDVYADGRLCRKDLESQRAMRIVVSNRRHEPTDDPNWQSRWVPETTGGNWQPRDSGFDFQTPADDGREMPLQPQWLAYRHWIRAGGRHKTSATVPSTNPFADWPEVDRPDDAITSEPAGNRAPVRYDRESGRLWCTGVLTDAWLGRLLARSDDPEYAAAVRELARRSHLAPVTPRYGYNRSQRGASRQPVRDLMLSTQVTPTAARGELLLHMTDGWDDFRCVFDFTGGEIRLVAGDTDQVVRTAPLTAEAGRPMLVEMSLFDSQVLVAVDGEPVCPPWTYTRRTETRGELLRKPVRIGSVGCPVQLRELIVYRDVFYQPGKARNGVDEPFQLGGDEFFVLGDNSPVSADSRSWDQGGVSERLLVGKPFLLHLPSRPGKIRIGDRAAYIRIPDLARIRYIH